MNTRLVNTAADVISRAMQRGRTLPAALAVALDSAQLLQSPETAAEYETLRAERNEFCDRVDTLTAVAKGNKRHVQEMYADLQKAQARIAELEKDREANDREYETATARVAELEAEAATQRRKGYQVAIDVMRQEKLPMSAELLEAQLELEALDTPAPEKRPAGGYPLALPWAKQMDADDLEGFLADLTDAASGDDDLTTLAAVEDAIGRWRVIGEAQHAHNTAPGPAAETGGVS